MKKVYRTILISAIALSVVLIFTRYQMSFLRLLDSFRDLGTALVYYFKVIFLNDNTYVPTVNQLPEVDLAGVLGIDVAEIVRKLEAFPDAFFSKEKFAAYNVSLVFKLNTFTQILTVALPVILVLYLILDSAQMSENNRHGKKTKPLKVFLKIFTKPFRASKKFLKGFISFAKGSRYVTALLWIWAINLNVVTMVVGFFAFYFYFAAAVTFAELPQQFVKLFLDVLIMFSGLPFLAWFFLFWKIFDKWRRSQGLDNLRHNESKNQGFLKKLSALIMIEGTVGAKKTTTAADMTLSFNVKFRNDSLDTLRKIDRHFVNFPWIKFEMQLKEAIESEAVYNLKTAKNFVADLARKYRNDPDPKNIFGYNVKDNPLHFDNGLVVRDIWRELEDYAKSYLLYTVYGSLVYANFSIRFDTKVIDEGNFPLYDDDFFDRPSTYPGDGSSYAHIVDYETLRLGKTIIDNNIKRGSFDFGILVLSEISKERLNQNGTDEMRLSDLDANQKNDGLNDKLEVIRHGAMVDNKCYAVVLSDLQRADAVNAGYRQLQDILFIADTSEYQLAMPGFVFEDMFHDLYKLLDKLRLKFRNKRGDRTLFSWILDNLYAPFENYYERIYNTYGYYETTIEIENGLKGDVRTHPYYLASKKIYSDRFSTDAYSDLIETLSERAGEGINQVPTYQGVKATLDELNSQNSFFFAKMEKLGGFDHENE